MGASKSFQHPIWVQKRSFVFDALSNAIRLSIVELLHENPGLRARDLAKVLKVSEPTIQRHIGILADAGILDKEYELHHYRLHLIRGDVVELIRQF